MPSSCISASPSLLGLTCFFFVDVAMARRGLRLGLRMMSVDGGFRPFPSPTPSSMTPCLRILTLTVGYASAPDRASDLISIFRSIPEESRPKAVEAIAQSVLFVGFPRILTSFASLEHADLLPPAHEDPIELEDDIFQRVYGTSTRKVTERMRRFHVKMESWVRNFGYQEVLGRTAVLGIRERELCALAVLAGVNAPAVLVGHIKGALKVGATRKEIR